MSEGDTFRDLVRRVRGRDEQAAAELVRRYEPAIRLAVRARLTDPRLRRLFDSTDVCQSVLANFFARAATGQFELERSEQLVKLLVTMARNHLINQAVKHRTARRGHGRLQQAPLDEDRLIDSTPSPSQVVADRELLAQFRGALTAEEQEIARRRADGLGWAEIAAALGEKPDALRVRFSRAMNRVARELGLEG